MKKILIVGINERIHSTAKIMEEANKMNFPFIFSKWSSISFNGEKIELDGKELDLNKVKSAFFDIPSFIIVKNGNEINFKLENELFIMLKVLKKKNIKANNLDFLLEYPYYNKFTQQYIFGSLNIPSINTIHVNDNREDKVIGALKKNRFRFPVVVKESRGGMGEKVWKVKNKEELADFIKDRRNVSLVFQPYIKNDGDFRVVIVNGKSLGIMKREAGKGQWKNNFALGGKIEKYIDKKMEKFAETACKKIGIKYAGVDVIKSEGKYLIIEINNFFCFEGFEKATGINIAKKILNSLI